MQLSKDDIIKIIPHRDPMLLVDSVSALVPGESIIASFYVDPSREIFAGHCPGEPVLPGVYTVECMAQASDILLLSCERYAGTIPLFIGIDGVKFKSKIVPGDTIEIRSKLANERIEKRIASCEAEVYCNGTLAACGTVTLAMR